MMTLVFLLGLVLTLTLAPETPIGRALRRWTIEIPAARLNGVSLLQASCLTILLPLLGLLLWLEAGDALILLGMAAPEIVAWAALFEISTIADMLGIAAVAWSGLRQRKMVSPPRFVRRIRVGRRRGGRARSGAPSRRTAANDDEADRRVAA